MHGFLDFMGQLGREFAELWRDALQAFALPERRDPAPARRIDTAQARMLHSLALLADAYNRNPDELATRAVSLLRAELEEEDRSPIRRAVRAWREKENRRGTEDTEPKPWSLQAVDFGSEPDRMAYWPPTLYDRLRDFRLPKDVDWKEEFRNARPQLLTSPQEVELELTPPGLELQQRLADEVFEIVGWCKHPLLLLQVQGKPAKQADALLQTLQAIEAHVRPLTTQAQAERDEELGDGGIEAAATDPWPDYEDHMEQLHLNGQRLLARVSKESARG